MTDSGTILVSKLYPYKPLNPKPLSLKTNLQAPTLDRRGMRSLPSSEANVNKLLDISAKPQSILPES